MLKTRYFSNRIDGGIIATPSISTGSNFPEIGSYHGYRVDGGIIATPASPSASNFPLITSYQPFRKDSGIGSGGAIAWTPAQITTDVWLDSSDLSTITVDGSNRISQWSDKSGNGRHLLQSVDANKPILSSGEITFDGTDDFLATSSNFYLTGNPEFYVFFVFKKTNNTKGTVFGWGQNNTLWAFGFYDDGSTTAYPYAGGNNYNVENITNNTITFCSYSKTPGAINSTSQAYKNGSVTGTSGHSTGTPAIASDKLILGRWMTFTGIYLQGVIYEFIVVRARLSTNERKTIEGYLAHKWGIVASLPSDHPYKSRPPYR